MPPKKQPLAVESFYGSSYAKRTPARAKAGFTVQRPAAFRPILSKAEREEGWSTRPRTREEQIASIGTEQESPWNFSLEGAGYTMDELIPDIQPERHPDPDMPINTMMDYELDNPPSTTASSTTTTSSTPTGTATRRTHKRRPKTGALKPRSKGIYNVPGKKRAARKPVQRNMLNYLDELGKEYTINSFQSGSLYLRDRALEKTILRKAAEIAAAQNRTTVKFGDIKAAMMKLAISEEFNFKAGLPQGSDKKKWRHTMATLYNHLQRKPRIQTRDSSRLDVPSKKKFKAKLLTGLGKGKETTEVLLNE